MPYLTFKYDIDNNTFDNITPIFTTSKYDLYFYVETDGVDDYGVQVKLSDSQHIIFLLDGEYPRQLAKKIISFLIGSSLVKVDSYHKWDNYFFLIREDEKFRMISIETFTIEELKEIEGIPWP